MAEKKDGNEDRKEKLDRELIELLNEIRVALPGVQVLFAFLLTVPFSQGYPKMTEIQRDVYFATFLAAAATTILLIAPTAYHRLRWRKYDKEQLLVTANRLAIGGTVFLALAIFGTVFLIGDFIFGTTTGAISLGAVAAALMWFWYGLPFTRKFEKEGATIAGHDVGKD